MAMAGSYEKWMEKNLYECQMFGFTSKAFMDYGRLYSSLFTLFMQGGTGGERANDRFI